MPKILYFIDSVGYNKYVVNAGAGDDDVWFPKPVKNKMLHNLYKLHFCWPLNNRHDAPLVHLWFRYLLEGLDYDSSEKVYVLFAESHHLAYSRGFLTYVKTRFPNSKFAFIFTNPVGTYNYEKLGTLRDYYDEVITFSEDDAGKYGFKLCRDMPYRLPEPSGDEQISSDVFFIGSNKGRYSQLLDIYNKLSDSGLICDFYICDVPEKEQVPLPGITYNKRITYDEVLQHTCSSRCVLEVLQKDCNYASIRTMEAMQYRKKLLTTNKYIGKELYYDNSIMRYVENVEDFYSFVMSPCRDDAYALDAININFTNLKKYLTKIFKDE